VRLGRRDFLRGAALGAAALAVPAPARAAGPVVERVQLTLPGLSPAHDGLRVAQLSDIHLGPRMTVEVLGAAYEAIARFEPDVVFLTGDFLSHHGHEVSLVRAMLGGLRAPTFAVLGNHDHWHDGPGTAAALRGHGYEVLENAWTHLTLRGEPLAIVGVGDAVTDHDDVPRALRGLTDPAALVLAHAPRTADVLRAHDRSLACFSGHTHGGQVYVPLVTPLYFSSVMGERYIRGAFHLGKVQLYVSRGLGASAGVRWLAPREVTLATIRAA
jgi:predicted MPP superfamily phosphohydrolase